MTEEEILSPVACHRDIPRGTASMVNQETFAHFTQDAYQLAIEASGIGFWDWNLRQNKQVWSDQCKIIFGLKPEDEGSFERFLSLVHPADRERVHCQIQECLTQGKKYDNEYRVIWPDKSLHWIHTRGQVIYDDERKPVRMISIAFDVTPQKEMEQEHDRLLEEERAARKEAEAARQRSDELIAQLEQKQAFLQAVMSQTPCGIFIAEAPGGRVFVANKEASKILGHRLIQCDTVAKYAQYHAFHPDGRRYLAEDYPLARALTGEMIMQEHALYQQGNGRFIHLFSSAAPIRDTQGNILASITTFYDVSERYELERKKDEFIIMASHELRTPLTSVKGNLQLTQHYLRRLLERNSSTLTTEGKTDIERLLQWNERALRQVDVESRLLNDILDASLIQTGALRVCLEPGNLAQAVRDAVSDVQTVAGNRTISLLLPDQPVIPVLLDHIRIEQVVTNYLTNALRYSPESKPVTVGITLNEHEARVWVQDAGPGLSLDEQQYIWERFSQVGNFVDYRSLGGSLGLGLYINHTLVRLHGGRSGVESTVGKGSVFWFTLPLAESERQASA
jgi:PAS domain S-box-containing protein